MSYDPLTTERMRAAHEEAHSRLLDTLMDAMLRGARATEQEPYRPLSDAVMEAIVRTVREQRPRRGDPAREYGPGFLRVLEKMRSHGLARFNKAPHGDIRPGDRRHADNPRPGDVINFERIVVVDDPSPIFFHPSTGKECPPFWPEPPDPKLRPYPLELPGYLWPDGGAADTLPVELAMASLRQVRWAPARPTLFVADGAPEPE
jgi:hypothetical protein